MRTFQARLQLDAPTATLLDGYGQLFGRALRTLHADRIAGHSVTKPAFMRRFHLTARQYNAVRVTLDGMLDSIRERRAGLLCELETRITAIDAKLAKTTSRACIHELKRRRRRLQDRRERDASGVTGICFGSRKLFNAQHHLQANGYASLDAWRRAWRDARSQQFFVLGSKDETSGCQGCTLQHLGGDRFLLRLRLPNTSAQRYVQIEATFAYGAAQLVTALTNKQAISFRFLRDEKG
ncbi:MAG TPA: hypothetical protein VFE36_13595, partial [Candidatus Baltobacteraceae bacterium]|nr:hypothetical protein [Candidatus Baltobacteraceae bacterium]